MKKQEFLKVLKTRLSGLPSDELDNRLSFYSEMIDDKIEEGKSEEQAILEFGTIDEIISEIAKDTPLMNLVKQRIKPKNKMNGMQIALIIISFPIWLPLLIIALTLIIVGLILLWVFVLIIYAIEFSLVTAFIASIALFFIYLFKGDVVVLFLGIALMSEGLSIIFFLISKSFTKLILKAHKSLFLNIKRKLIKGGEKHE